jgi:hypothetical protein
VKKIGRSNAIKDVKAKELGEKSDFLKMAQNGVQSNMSFGPTLSN